LTPTTYMTLSASVQLCTHGNSFCPACDIRWDKISDVVLLTLKQDKQSSIGVHGDWFQEPCAKPKSGDVQFPSIKWSTICTKPTSNFHILQVISRLLTMPKTM
jgi:hypothetical protein